LKDEPEPNSLRKPISLEADLQTHLPCLRQQAGLVLEAQRAGEVGERALDWWRGGGLRGAAAAAALERGRAAVAAALERGRGGA
jgi:hypothetical protein